MPLVLGLSTGAKYGTGDVDRSVGGEDFALNDATGRYCSASSFVPSHQQPARRNPIAIGPRATREFRRRQPSLSITDPARLRGREQSRFERARSAQLRPEDAV